MTSPQSPVSLQSLPLDIITLIYSHLSIRDQLKLSRLNKFFYHVSCDAVYSKIIIVFQNFKTIDIQDYRYKYRINDESYTIIKSSPVNFGILVTKLSYIKKIHIFDNVNGLITNWHTQRFHLLLNKSDIQHCFSIRSLSRIDPNIKTLELNLVSRGCTWSDSLKYSSIKFIQRIDNLILLTNSFERLHKFEFLISKLGTRLKLQKLVIKTYAVNVQEEMHPNSDKFYFHMLNYNRIIDLQNLEILELSMKQDTLVSSKFWIYFFKFFFSFFNDIDIINSNDEYHEEVRKILIRVLVQDFDWYENFEDFCYQFFTLDKEYQLKYNKLRKLSIAMYSNTDCFIPLNYLQSFILKTPTLTHLSIHFNNAISTSALFKLHSKQWFKNFYNQIVPKLKFFEDRFFINNFCIQDQHDAEHFESKFKQIYKEITGNHIMNFDPIAVLQMLLDNLNDMKLHSQFITSVTFFDDNKLMLSSDESVTNDYYYESYINHVSEYKKRRVILKIVQLIKVFLYKEGVFTNLQKDTELILNNIKFKFVDNELICLI